MGRASFREGLLRGEMVLKNSYAFVFYFRGQTAVNSETVRKVTGLNVTIVNYFRFLKASRKTQSGTVTPRCVCPS